MSSAAVVESGQFALVSSETIPLTRQVAIAHRDMPASPTERLFDENRAKKLRQAFEDGRLLPCQWAKAVWKGKEVRMNGQHSSRVIAELEKIPDGMTVHMDVYEPADEAGMGQLFRQFDARVSSRSSVDVCHAYQGMFPALEGVDQKKALLAAKGINYYHKQTGEGILLSGDDMGKLFFNRTYDPFLIWVDELLSGKCKELQRMEVLAVVYGTFCVSESKSRQFWNDVKTAAVDDSVSQMLDAQLEKDREQTDRKKKLGPVQVYGICCRAWNAYLAGDVPPRNGFTQPAAKALPEIHSA